MKTVSMDFFLDAGERTNISFLVREEGDTLVLGEDCSDPEGETSLREKSIIRVFFVSDM